MLTLDYEAEFIHSGLLRQDNLFRFRPPEDWFTSPRHRRVYKIMRDLAEEDRCNVVEVQKALGFSDDWAMYLARLQGHIGDAEVAYEGLRRDALRREVLQIAHALGEAARDPLSCVEESAAEAMMALSKVGGSGGGPTKVTAILSTAIERVRQLCEAGGRLGLETGFSLLDNLVGGWEPGKLYIVAARPKAGKTAFLMQSAVDAYEQGTRVYVASLEMGDSQFGIRLISQTSSVAGGSLRIGKLSDADMGRVVRCVDRFKPRSEGFLVDTRARLPWEQLRASVLREHSRQPLGFVGVDYVQLLRLQERRENRAAELEEIAYDLKALAKELNAPVVALAQLNREQDETKPPSVDKLKGSGGLEQAADAVVLLWRPDPKQQQVIEIIVGANRDGPVGKFKAQFRPEYTRFE